MSTAEAEPLLLPADIDPDPYHGEHPTSLTDDEVLAGLDLWRTVDDLDDYSTGLTSTPGPITAGVGLALAVERARLIRAVMLRYGVPEVSIELVDGRDSGTDSWNALNPVSVFSHHIASHPTVDNPTPGLSLVTRGRSDLPGPLCNGTAGVDLVYRIKCLGWANHPGTGGPTTFSGPLGSFTVPRDVARPYAWGTEYEGGFTDEVWNKTYTNRRTGISMTFREFMGRCNAALCEAIWLDGLSSRGRYSRIVPGMDLSGYHGEHKTWAPGRKPDRRNYSTEQGRAEVRRYSILLNQPDPQPITPTEDDMPTPDDLWNHQIPVYDGTGGKSGTKSARVVVSQAHNRTQRLLNANQAQTQTIRALRGVVAGVVERSGTEQDRAALAALAAIPDLDDVDLTDPDDEDESGEQG